MINIRQKLLKTVLTLLAHTIVIAPHEIKQQHM